VYGERCTKVFESFTASAVDRTVSEKSHWRRPRKIFRRTKLSRVLERGGEICEGWWKAF